ncbi:hypothetical protein BX600DRAFT_491748 [Xylariales sp. PMI_506]|nr:hypothetical protein BX600DRAFT_491748 [Xylariales sp. PMI_506]
MADRVLLPDFFDRVSLLPVMDADGESVARDMDATSSTSSGTSPAHRAYSSRKGGADTDPCRTEMGTESFSRKGDQRSQNSEVTKRRITKRIKPTGGAISPHTKDKSPNSKLFQTPSSSKPQKDRTRGRTLSSTSPLTSKRRSSVTSPFKDDGVGGRESLEQNKANSAVDAQILGCLQTPTSLVSAMETIMANTSNSNQIEDFATWDGDSVPITAAPQLKELRKRPFDKITGSPYSTEATEEHSKDKWKMEQKLLHAVIQSQGEYSLMPTSWEGALKGFPIPASVFYRQTKSTSARPRIYARNPSKEFEGTKKFLALADGLPARIRDVRAKALAVCYDTSKLAAEKDSERAILGREMARKIRLVLEDAIKWAREDGGLAVYGTRLATNIVVEEITEENVITASLFIHNTMKHLAETWVKDIEDLGSDKFNELAKKESQLPAPPVVYGIFLIQHQVLIVHLDAENPTATYYVETRLIMNSTTHQQWNALAIMATICWARDKLMAMAEKMKLPHEEDDASSDPDA